MSNECHICSINFDDDIDEVDYRPYYIICYECKQYVCLSCYYEMMKRGNTKCPFCRFDLADKFKSQMNDERIIGKAVLNRLENNMVFNFNEEQPVLFIGNDRIEFDEYDNDIYKWSISPIVFAKYHIDIHLYKNKRYKLCYILNGFNIFEIESS